MIAKREYRSNTGALRPMYQLIDALLWLDEQEKARAKGRCGALKIAQMGQDYIALICQAPPHEGNHHGGMGAEWDGPDENGPLDEAAVEGKETP